MKTINKIFAILACSMLALTSCDIFPVDGEEAGAGSSTDGYFFTDVLAYNLLSNKVVEIPVVRLGTSGNLTVQLSVDAPSIFNVPTSVTIKDRERIANIPVSYDISNVAFNTDYEIKVKVENFSSAFGYEQVSAFIQYPTSYAEYGKGTIVEDWWGEQEDKPMFARDFAADLLQCYLPECWGHDSGAGYPVQDYVFYWNTKTNKVYVPVQYMGCEDWNIADRGAIACKFGGPNHKEGSAAWMSFIDDFYAKAGYPQPHYDPSTKKFYLSDSAAISPEDGSVSYGNPGAFDIYTLE